jgi:hypothetical protein
MAVEMTDAGLALRKGHRVTVFWGIIKGNERGSYVASYNHTTGNLSLMETAINHLAVPAASMGFIIGMVIGVFAIVCMDWESSFAVLIIRRSKQKKSAYRHFAVRRR